MKILFITNLCPHYRVKTFETLAQRVATRFIFFSQGGEKYWNASLHGKKIGNFPHEYLWGLSLGPVRFTPALLRRIWQTDADVIIKCVNGRFALPITYCLARLRRKPFVLWTGLWSHPKTWFHRFTFPIVRYIYTHADAIAVYGSHVRDYLIDLGVSPERVFVAPHAVDNALYARADIIPVCASLLNEIDISGRKIILYVGRLEPSKGISDLLLASHLLGDLKPVVLFVGTGELQKHLKRQAQLLQVETRFVGYVATTDLYRYYALADAFVLPSVTTQAGKEPWGLVINEAMNQGAPVVVSTAVGAAAGGLVRHAETGLIFPEGDQISLASCLRRLLTDEPFARQLGENAKREIAGWTNSRMVEGFLAAVQFAFDHQ